MNISDPDPNKDLTQNQIDRCNYKKDLFLKPNPKCLEFNQNMIKPETPTQVMNELGITIGFRGITPDIIRDWVWSGSQDEVREIPANDLLEDSAIKTW